MTGSRSRSWIFVIVTSSPIDGIHFEADGHRSIGAAVAVALREMLSL